MSEGCYYVSLGASVFGWTQMIPIFFTVASFVLTAATNQAIYFLFAIYLFIPQYIVWCFQYYFQYERPDPICQLYHTWAFPSMESMYTGAIIGAFFTYAYYWPVYQSWVTWFFIYCFATVPPFILIYMEYNRWWEVLFSYAFGFLSSVAFMLVVKFFLKPKMYYLKLFFPFYLMNYSDDMIKKEKNHESLLILRAIQRADLIDGR